jgi:hypothetical protein
LGLKEVDMRCELKRNNVREMEMREKIHFGAQPMREQKRERGRERERERER